MRTPHLYIEEATTLIDLSTTHLPAGFAGSPAVPGMTNCDRGIEPRAGWAAGLDDAEQMLTNA